MCTRENDPRFRALPSFANEVRESLGTNSSLGLEERVPRPLVMSYAAPNRLIPSLYLDLVSFE